MWVGNLLPFDRFQKKNNYNHVRWQFTTFWQIPDKNNYYNYARKLNWQITIMWEGNLLPFDRFQTKKIITIVRGQFTTYWQIPDKYNNYNYVRGQFTTFWQIPDKKNNYNYARGQFTTFWQIPDKKIITICDLLPFDRFQSEMAIYYILTDSRQKKLLQLCERAIYYLLTDSRQKNYNYARGQITTYWQIPDKIIITIMWEGNLLPIDRFQTKK